MSYDLYLKPRSGALSKYRFFSYFEGRGLYTLQGEQAWYQNEDTGVYFSFELSNTDETAEDDDPAMSYPLSFNMNFFRPSFFVLEAEPELSRVVSDLNCAVFDPQADGMGQGDYDAELFVSGWKKGNEFGYSAVLRDSANRTGVVGMPTAELERIWQWNYSRGDLQQELGDSVFVPRIIFFKHGAGLVSAVVWSDAIPTAFPKVDSVVVYRKELAPRKLFRRRETINIVDWAEVEPIIESVARPHSGTLVHEYAEAPPSIIAFVKGLPPSTVQLNGVPADSVLDSELLERYAA